MLNEEPRLPLWPLFSNIMQSLPHLLLRHWQYRLHIYSHLYTMVTRPSLIHGISEHFRKWGYLSQHVKSKELVLLPVEVVSEEGTQKTARDIWVDIWQEPRTLPWVLLTEVKGRAWTSIYTWHGPYPLRMWYQRKLAEMESSYVIIITNRILQSVNFNRKLFTIAINQ